MKGLRCLRSSTAPSPAAYCSARRSSSSAARPSAASAFCSAWATAACFGPRFGTSSRIFRSAIDTLDTAYRVEERRSTLALWSMGMLFALFAVVVVTAILSMVVVGPLLGGGRAIADRMGFGAAFEV